MKIILAALGMLILAVAPALSAGFERVMAPDLDGPPLEAGIWYPSNAPASSRRLGLYTQAVAVGGEVAGRGLPLVVMSHGTGGSFEGHYDTALALAEAGFVVAAVTHTGDNYRDQSGSLLEDPRKASENRPRHIRALIDYLLTSWPQHDRLDPMHIGIFGFSAGGFTALVAIGGVPDLSLAASSCAAYPDDWGCRRGREIGRRPSPPPAAFVRDPRIAAAVIAAPLGVVFTPAGLAGITVPIQLWRGERDEIVPHPRHAQNVYDGLPAKPGHFAFLAPCTPAFANVAPEGCRDPAGFDREAFHREFNSDVVAFFKATLASRRP
jgi:predicted dienelactone hydrolase